MDRENLIHLTADIVASHVANNSIAISDVPMLVEKVHDALSGLGKGDPGLEPRQPIVSVRSSVKPDNLTCLVCGKKQKTLKRHLSTAHDLTPRQYREEFGLPASYPMTAPNYSKLRQDMAKRIGLGRKGKAAPKARSKGNGKAS